MSEESFWRSTPRKLKALIDVHISINKPDEDDSKPSAPRRGYIDQVL